ncbi:MAG: fimbrillin family protein [Bacteroidales bacterium]|nr:fimbrillin family protein [Bacteroidales bacterium]
MKHILPILITAALVLPNCSKGTYSADYKENYSYSTALPVRVSVGSPSLRGAGPVEDFSGLVGKRFNVYAFRKSPKVSYTSLSLADPLSCLVDASSEGDMEQVGGKVARIGGKTFYADWTGRRINWPSGDRHQDAYDFFAYYIDNAEVSEIRREDDNVSIALTIDGTQDIMLSKAALTPSQLSGLSASDREEAAILSYSHFTAVRAISPVFTFRHQLVRLDFDAAPDVAVQVLSPKNALLTVAHKDESSLGISFTDNVGKMIGNAAREYAFEVKGGTVFVAPAESYRIYVTSHGRTVEAEITNPQSGNPFCSGEKYSVRLSQAGQDAGIIDVETELK